LQVSPLLDITNAARKWANSGLAQLLVHLTLGLFNALRNYFVIFQRLIAIILSAAFPVAYAGPPSLIYQYGPGAKVIGVNALVNIEEAQTESGSNCDQRIAEVVVDEVVYEGVSTMIAGFRAKKPAPKEWYVLFRMDSRAIYQSISNAASADVQALISKGARLVVIYQVCGSGGFVSVRDVFKKSAVNNP
jgi:hypothetical protein